MKTGDRVVCINDTPGKLDGVKKLKEGEIYTVLNANKKDVFVIPNDLSWDKRRFKLIHSEWAEELLNSIPNKQTILND